MKRSSARRTRTADPAPAAPAPPARPWPWLALLALATLGVFAGALRNDWIFTDDAPYVFQNPIVSRGLTPEGAAWALRGPHGGNWHPLTSLVHLANVSLFGLAPIGHHAVNLALHALNAVLVALVGYAYTGFFWRSLIAAAFFALHPLRVESVAWAAELKDVLSAALFLATLLAYRRWVARPGAARYAALLVAFALALAAKPMAVTLPVLLLVLDGWPLGRLAGRLRARIVEKAPLFVLAAAAAALTALAQHQVGAIASFDSTGPGYRLANAAVTVWRYLGKTLWPEGLAVFYPAVPIPPLVVVAAVAGIAAVTAGAWWLRRARPYLAAGWAWYLAMLAPVIGIVQVGGQAYADRYTYLPTLGILWAATWAIADLAARRPLLRAATLTVALVALAALAAATVRQVALWRNTRTLYQHALRVTPDNPMSQCSLATALMEAGEFPEAIVRLERALQMAPGFTYAQDNLGRALLLSGRPAEAIPHLERALPHHDGAAARDYLGSAYAGVGRLEEAAREFRAALAFDPAHHQALFHLGQVLATQGRYAEAGSAMERAVAGAPHDLDRRRQLALTRLFGGQVEEAVAEYERILAVEPDDLDALTRIAWTRATHPEDRFRDGAEALRYAERARAAAAGPRALVESVRAAALAELGRFEDAGRAGERALGLAREAGDAEGEARYAGQLREYRARRALRIEP